MAIMQEGSPCSELMNVMYICVERAIVDIFWVEACALVVLV
jgi:hypothetical protein